VPAHMTGDQGVTRFARGRIRWWLRTGGLLAVIGVMRLARILRARWEPVFLLAGTLLTVTGVMLPNTVAVLCGVPVLFFALLKGLTARDPSGPCSYRSYLAPPH
jgi:hypothetical protein